MALAAGGLHEEVAHPGDGLPVGVVGVVGGIEEPAHVAALLGGPGQHPVQDLLEVRLGLLDEAVVLTVEGAVAEVAVELLAALLQQLQVLLELADEVGAEGVLGLAQGVVGLGHVAGQLGLAHLGQLTDHPGGERQVVVRCADGGPVLGRPGGPVVGEPVPGLAPLVDDGPLLDSGPPSGLLTQGPPGRGGFLGEQLLGLELLQALGGQLGAESGGLLDGPAALGDGSGRRVLLPQGEALGLLGVLALPQGLGALVRLCLDLLPLGTAALHLGLEAPVVRVVLERLLLGLEPGEVGLALLPSCPSGHTRSGKARSRSLSGINCRSRRSWMAAFSCCLR